LKRLLLASPLLFLGCHQQSPSKPLSQLTPPERAGRQVFENRCSACHYADSEQGLQGPGLQGLFRKPYLPSGRVANDARVTGVIMGGWAMMPPVGGTLSDEQLADLLAYLHTL
jgi:mono/diheme cytochrome c family protein